MSPLLPLLSLSPLLRVFPLITDPVTIFLVVLLIILVTPIIFTRLKIPHIIGLIVAGLAVGPYGFNILDRDMSFEVFGQVGILWLMFLAGIEIDMYNLRRNIRRGVIFGAYTFVVPLVVGTLASLFMLGFDMLTSLLVASMFCAHTLIAYPIVSRFGLTKQPAVIIAVTATIFTVLGSLIVLAGVTGVYREGEFSVAKILRIIGLLALYCLVVTYAYPRITRWFFKHFNDGILQFIFILAMAFGAAKAVNLAGVESVFGAFFAGLVLNRYVPARSPLMSRLEFVGNAIFIPYFLIGVGMLINIGVIWTDESSIYIALVMSAVAMLSKWIAAWIAQKTFRMRPVDRSMLYQLTNAHTAVALAVVTIGYNMGIFGETILNATVLMILVTCTVSSIGTASAATKMKTMIASETTPDTVQAIAEAVSHRRPTRTLIPVANPMTARELVDLALLMRGKVADGSGIYALHVRSDNTAMSRSLGRNSLDMAANSAAAMDEEIETIERYDLNFVTGVINTVEERDITELFIGLHRRTAVIDSFFGEKLEQLLRSTNRMIVISRCFIPVNTVTRVVVAVPPMAEFETGFRRWVEGVANLTRQLGCRVIFCAHPHTRQTIRAVIRAGRYEIRHEYRDVEHFDDFILLANRVLDDDLFIVVNARRTSISFNTDLDQLPSFLQRYFSSNNLVVIYPEQFGDDPLITANTSAEALSTDLASRPSTLWLKIMQYYREAVKLKKRWTHRNRRPRIDL
ncbi:MAG: cation:proton antiporter [Clostridium sp.]|nr:cation:proton antiporter [Clostridium sp.]